MTRFVDTVYFVALLDPGDRWHRPAVSLSRALHGQPFLTTQEVLAEVLTYFAAYGPAMRAATVRMVERLERQRHVEIMPQSDASFRMGLALYRTRLDKGYSLIDCTSMALMRARGITEVLTHDHHFVQEGFVALLRDA